MLAHRDVIAHAQHTHTHTHTHTQVHRRADQVVLNQRLCRECGKRAYFGDASLRVALYCKVRCLIIALLCLMSLGALRHGVLCFVRVISSSCARHLLFLCASSPLLVRVISSSCARHLLFLCASSPLLVRVTSLHGSSQAPDTVPGILQH